MRTTVVPVVAALLLTACGAGGRDAGSADDAAGGVEPVAASGSAPVGGDAPCSGFALSLPAGVTGRPTAVAAAEWSAVHGGLNAPLPADGWVDAGTDESGAHVRSGAWTLHVVQVPDGTWAVDSGTSC